MYKLGCKVPSLSVLVKQKLARAVLTAAKVESTVSLTCNTRVYSLEVKKHTLTVVNACLRPWRQGLA